MKLNRHFADKCNKMFAKVCKYASIFPGVNASHAPTMRHGKDDCLLQCSAFAPPTSPPR